MASKKPPETVQELIDCLREFEPDQIVVAHQVFSVETFPILEVAPIRTDPGKIAITFDLPPD
jgi:hypothetical protein